MSGHTRAIPAAQLQRLGEVLVQLQPILYGRLVLAEEGMGEGLLGAEPLGWVYIEEAQEERLGVLGELLDFGLHVHHQHPVVLGEDLVGVIAREEESAREQVVHYHAHAEYVRLLRVTLTPQYFRCYISWRSAFHGHDFILFVFPRQPQVGNPNIQHIRVTRVQQYVFRLQVSVYNLFLMHKVHRQQYLGHDSHGVLLIEPLPGLDGLYQVPSLLVLEQEVHVLAALEDLVQLEHAAALEQVPVRVDLLDDRLDAPLSGLDGFLTQLLDGVLLGAEQG